MNRGWTRIEKTARGNQERDSLRDEKLTSLGYEVLRVKERDWKQDQESVIKECLEFIHA
jgi:very-short-patch-repair endonuclease